MLIQHWTNRVSYCSVIRPILDKISEVGLVSSSFSIVFAREANQAAHYCDGLIKLAVL